MRKLFGEAAIAEAAARQKQLYYLDQAVSLEDAQTHLALDPGGVSCEGTSPIDDNSPFTRESALLLAHAQQRFAQIQALATKASGEEIVALFLQVRDFASLTVVDCDVILVSDAQVAAFLDAQVLFAEDLASLKSQSQGVPLWGLLVDDDDNYRGTPFVLQRPDHVVAA